MRRHEARWDGWDQRLRQGQTPADVLPTLSDERIVELLASGDPALRRYELDLLATELLNRLRRRRGEGGPAGRDEREAPRGAPKA